MTSKVTFSAKDFDSEGTRFGFNVTDIVAGNITAILGLIDDLQTAANGIVLGTFDGKKVSVVDVIASAVPVDPYAQREAKWLCTYTDDVDPLGNGQFEIGMPDLSLMVAGTKNLDLAGTEGAAFKAAVEAVVRSRLNNAVTLVSAEHVGRNI